MKELVILLEEPSAKEMLDIVVPKLVPDMCFRCIPFEGKQDLEKNITRKLKCYQNKDARFLVVHDQDSNDCKVIKQQLIQKCIESGRTLYKVRIMCHELETVYLADLMAVENGLHITHLAHLQGKNPYRQPDALGNAKQKLKELVSQHKGIYQDIAGSRAISPHLDLNNVRSASFKNLIAAIQELSV